MLRHLAVVRDAQGAQVVEYEMRGGNYRFELEKAAYYVRANPQIQALEVADLGAAAPLVSPPWYKAHKDPVALVGPPLRLRFFERIGRGYAELPVTDVMRGWSDFLNQAVQVVVKSNRAGHPELNQDLVVLENGEELPGYAVLAQALKRAGVSAATAAGFIRHLVETQRAGEASEANQSHVWSWLVPFEENPMQVLPYLAIGLVYGFQISSDTPLGELYRGAGQGMGLVLLSIPIVVWLVVRRFKK